MSGRRLLLRISVPVPSDAAVRVDLQDCVLLAEVCACGQQDGSYVAILEVEHAVAKVSDLSRLVAAVIERSQPATAVHNPAPNAIWSVA